jgi:cytochrome P450
MTRPQTEVVQMDGEEIVLVRGLRDIRRVCMDWAHFSNDVLGRIQIPAEDKTRDFRQYPIEFDPPAHGAWRALVEDMFARPRSPEFQARIRDLVSGMVADLAKRGGGEIVRDFALPLQSRALAVLLDMPLSEGDLWASWGFHVFRSDGENDLDRAGALVRYLERTLDAATGDDSFFGRLQRMTIDGRPLTRREQLGFAHLVFAGGRDTVINLISGGIGYLASNPDVFDQFKANPALAVPATEELVRFISPLSLLGRVCPGGGQINDKRVQPGQRVGLCFAQANRDPAIFDAPDTIRIDRNPNPHVAFGSGPHTCIGNAHARLLSRTVLTEFARVFDRLDVVEAAQRSVDPQVGVSGLHFSRLVINVC